MILRTRGQHADDEKALRDWLRDNLGVDDAELLASFVWENEHRGLNAADAYLSGLAQIVKGTVMMGRPFVGNLLEMAKKPKDIREAEMELVRFAAETLPKLVERVKRHNGAPEVVKHVIDELVTLTRERIEKMWPGRPDYIVNSAVACGVIHKDKTFGIEPAAIAKMMLQDDVLKSARGG